MVVLGGGRHLTGLLGLRAHARSRSSPLGVVPLQPERG